jgi:hypothetical protein
MFNAAKDAIASEAAKRYVNNVIARYGKVDGLKIDSRNKTMWLTCLLEGEAQPITVNVGQYVIESEGPKRKVKILECTCSRPWVQSLLQDFVKDRPIELPAWAASAL